MVTFPSKAEAEKQKAAALQYQRYMQQMQMQQQQLPIASAFTTPPSHPQPIQPTLSSTFNSQQQLLQQQQNVGSVPFPTPSQPLAPQLPNLLTGIKSIGTMNTGNLPLNANTMYVNMPVAASQLGGTTQSLPSTSLYPQVIAVSAM